MKALGRQIVVEYYGCNPVALNNVAFIKRAMRNAAEASGATIVQEAFHVFNPHGVSGVVVIQESHLAIHTWPERKVLHIDLVTCSKLDKIKVENVIKEIFNPDKSFFEWLN